VSALTIFVSSYIFIALKAFQQRHVIHNDWWWVPPTSMAMAFVEFYVIATVAKNGYGMCLVIAGGSGAGLGALTAMYLHNIHLKRKQQ
jgi:hypothetical protein